MDPRIHLENRRIAVWPKGHLLGMLSSGSNDDNHRAGPTGKLTCAMNRAPYCRHRHDYRR